MPGHLQLAGVAWLKVPFFLDKVESIIPSATTYVELDHQEPLSKDDSNKLRR